MNNRKTRILACGEASYLQTGFATYQHNLLKRLHATDKYEITELASYFDITNQRENRWRSVPWNIIPVLPDRNNKQECEAYQSNPSNEFGELKFEQALVHVKPDVVIDVRDFWHCEFQGRSVLRNYFKWAIMPAVDSMPVDDPWLSMCMDADAVFSYTDWGLDVLNKQSNNKIKTVCEAPPGANFDIFKIINDKAGLKQSLGINPNSLIVGTVMRNQARKLYSDLIESFAKLIADEQFKDNVYLYLHTAWPDLGWNIPKLITEAGIGHRTVLTYACKACNAIYPSFFQDSIANCKFCGQLAAGFPTSQHGIATEDLAKIMSLFDVYVQYSNCEGFGMPLAEAAACGIPVMAVDYSAMSDVVRKLGGIDIPIDKLLREPTTHRYVASPNNEAFIERLRTILLMPESSRRGLGYKAHLNAKKYYDWDQTVQRWMNYFDSISDESKWNTPSRLHYPNPNIPNGLSNSDFINWCISNIAGEPENTNSYMAFRLLRDLNWGMTVGYGQHNFYFSDNASQGSRARSMEFTRDTVINLLKQRCQLRNFWESQRTK